MFDLVVVTAANAAQAKGYRSQLKGRTGFLVVADPGGKRVGSLGATVNVLGKIGYRRGDKRRVLICHSGGDARRTPGYAAMGKAFVPMADGRPMLDHIIDEMAKLPSASGVLVCCGDVIPYLGGGKVELADRGVTGVAYPDGPGRARRHGVYTAAGRGKGLSEVVAFRQKPAVRNGKFLIDTGIMFIDPATAAKMTTLPVAGDIYGEFPEMLLGGFAPFSVSVVGSCRFFHVGSSAELLKLLGKGGKLVDGVQGNELELAGNNIVTNVPRSYGKIKLDRGECLTCLPLGRNEWYTLRYRIEDNFKQDGLWEKHGLGEKMKRVDHARLLAVRSGRRRAVRVTAPVRIDFAGGWSDTPPICYREGGTVLAAAVTLDGKRPIEVTVRPRRDKFVKIVSLDLGKRSLIKDAAELADRHDPHDWRCLVKNALAVTGFRFGEEEGLDITIAANLPKGSGMGTSSMLGAAAIAALLGKVDVDEVGSLTLRLEQEMRTGGGWEDQFAGMVGGVKIMRSKPGKDQRIVVERLDIGKTAESLAERSLLYFTGQKRMARNVLRRVLGFYAENPHNFAKILVDSVKRTAEKSAEALVRGDLDVFAESVNGYWRDKKLLDAGSTNDRVEELAAMIKPYTSALSLAGAGGGGFMYILARSRADAKKIRRLLTENPPSKWARFYDFAIDERGMTVENQV